MAKAWYGSKNCDVCQRPVHEQGPEFYDASVREFKGKWALLCYTCGAARYLFMGQVYDSETFLKKGNIQH